jgi:hypothetical protein
MQTRFDIHAPPVTLQHPTPTQIVLQIVGRHAMETLHPLFQPMVIPVHVLDVIRTDHPFALAIVHYLMGYALLFAETGIHTRTIATQHCIRLHQRLQDRDDRLGIYLLQLKIRMVASTVLHHHHRDVIRPGSTGSPLATTMPWRTR